MNMSCQRCGGPIGRQTGSGGRRKFCSTCSPKRVRNKGGGQRQQSRPAVTAQPSEIPQGAVTNVYDATLAEVKALGMTDHYLGALALHVARMLDDSAGESGSAVASLAKGHRETVNEMRAAAPKPREESVLEQLRRENRERGGRI
jgi:hypothetical protein